MEQKRKLSQTDVRKLPDGNHNFGDGLYLRVYGNSRTWAIRLQVKGKRTIRGLGSAMEITLGQARIECARQRAAMLAGDMQTKSQKNRKEESKKKALFKDVWEQAVDARARVAQWKTDAQYHQWRQSITDHALPYLGNLPVADIDRKDILCVLEPIWDKMPSTATKVRNRLEIVFDWCIREGFREKENPARWKGQIEFDLPSLHSKIGQKHHEAPTLLELQTAAPRLLETGTGKCALFGILTACRVSEFLKAQWNEVDFKKRVWSVPPERRKDKKPFPHRVPLSDQAIKLLRSIPQESEYIFKGRVAKTYSLDSCRKMLRDVICRPVTAHGCRSTFRDWCAEHGVDHIVAEKCLMHSTGDAVVQAYQRSDMLEQRRGVMQKWADAVFEQVK